LVAYVEREHPDALDTLAGWRLDPGSLPAREPNLPETPAMKNADLCLIDNVRGVVSILDPNVGARRRAVSGMRVFPGEAVEAEPGSAFDLRRCGSENAVKQEDPAVLSNR
jgi:hypothetical protein